MSINDAAVADEVPQPEARIAVNELSVKEAGFLSGMPQPVPTPKPQTSAEKGVLVKRTDKGKGKAVDYQLPPHKSKTSKRECHVSEGQVLAESHFGPLDLGLRPIRVSNNRNLLRRKPRRSDDAI
ncbi:hypothetical protein IWW38_004908 [Coemansia aciculifera]|uniref:Uncharacterized protein n=1 Tax=Coemansia aciculifera TaxID=417176 RepID=A0ACC1LWY9_9FUNG|nr:hypothetical protein IWW38_004908 [Coemansia aciculifera]